MHTKVQKIKTKRPKNNFQKSFTQKIADQVGCSTRMVRYVLDGKRSQETKTAQKILLAAAIIEESENRLLDEIKRVVTF